MIRHSQRSRHSSLEHRLTDVSSHLYLPQLHPGLSSQYTDNGRPRHRNRANAIAGDPLFYLSNSYEVDQTWWGRAFVIHHVRSFPPA